MKKIFLAITFFAVIFLLSGCAKKPSADKGLEAPDQQSQTGGQTEELENTKIADATFLNACPQENVSLANYGEPGQRLRNCFVKYLGEPSRGDKSYYIIEDICGQFTQKFMENMYGANLDRLEQSQVASINNCTYYFDEKEYVMLNLEYLSIENQKKGNEAMDRKMEKNTVIPMENFVAIQEDGVINAIYLVLSPNKFLSLRPSSKKAIEREKFINLAANIAAAIKGYK